MGEGKPSEGLRRVWPEGASRRGAFRCPGTLAEIAALRREGERDGAERTEVELWVGGGILPAIAFRLESTDRRKRNEPCAGVGLPTGPVIGDPEETTGDGDRDREGQRVRRCGKTRSEGIP
jgi:hypothetical protein